MILAPMYHFINQRLKTPWLWQLALACYWGALFLGTHVPIERIPLQDGATDKFAHLSAFGMLAMVFAITWQVSAGRLMARHLIWAWIAIAIYGAVEEMTQPIVGRTASIGDWLADASGAAMGLVVFACVRHLRERAAGASCHSERSAA
jgi:VanZ family protein